MKKIKNYVTRRLARLSETAYNSMNIRPAQEHAYRYLFVRDVARAGISDDFYPVGHSANFSLLYLLVRCFEELALSHVVEFGGGQSSMLMDRLAARHSPPIMVTTFEQDADWAETIAAKVQHRVVHAPLAKTMVGERSVMFYDAAYLGGLKPPNLVLIDGPTAYSESSRYDRTGAVNFLSAHLQDEFVVIFDDCERAGEAEAAARFRAWLEQRAIPFYENAIKAAKQQRIFCTKKFRAAAYF